LVPTASLQAVPSAQVTAQIEQALATGEPVPGWDKMHVWASDLRKPSNPADEMSAEALSQHKGRIARHS